MKTRKLSFILFLLLTTAMTGLTSCAQGLKGNGDVVFEQRTVTAFTHLTIQGVFNVFLNQGEKEAVRVEADENLQNAIETVNKANTLLIKWKDKASVKKSTKMNVYVTVKDLQGIDIDGVGNVSTTSVLQAENLKLRFSGVGTASLEMNCNTFSADISAVGNITLKGTSNTANLTASGAGNLSAFELVVKKLTLNVSGIGNTEVRAEEEIRITSSGIGNVSYTGNAVVNSLNTSGIGKVKKV